MTTSVTGATRRRTVQEEETASGGGAGSTQPSQTPPPSGGTQQHIDANIAAAARNAKPRGDGILYVGLNPTSNRQELAAVESANRGQVTALMGQGSSVVETKFGRFDLSSPTERDRFCLGMTQHYGVSVAQGMQLKTLLDDVPASGQDEIARLALHFARAEGGHGDMPSRLVLSGHSTGGKTYGETWDKKRVADFDYAIVRRLGEIMPRAAAQIEDIHLGACMTYGQVQNEGWRRAFPNLKTMWGYDGYSPTANVGDMSAWAARTRGRVDVLTQRSIAPFVHSDGGVVAWSARGDVVESKTKTLEQLRASIGHADRRFEGYLSGSWEVPDHTDYIAREDYKAYQALAARRDATPSERAEAQKRADVMLRVRFYAERGRHVFAEQHGAVVGAGFRALGLPAPDFAKLSREDAMDQVAAFRRVAGTPPRADVAEASRWLDDLATLNPATIEV